MPGIFKSSRFSGFLLPTDMCAATAIFEIPDVLIPGNFGILKLFQLNLTIGKAGIHSNQHQQNKGESSPFA
jgi:hypothetical protein